MPHIKDESLPVSRLIPSSVTMLSLCAGLTAILMALNERFETAITMILIAAFLDGIDGRVARALHSNTNFGAELDSLCDLVNFGVAPGLVMYIWHLKNIKFFGWGAVLFGVICMATRLARFNAMLNEDYDSELRKKFFLGIPAPMGGILVLLPLMCHLESIKMGNFKDYSLIIYHFIINCLVASRMPTLSGKSIVISKRNAAVCVVILTTIAMLAIQELLRTVIGVACFYVLLLPYGIVSYHMTIRKRVRK